MRNNLSKKEAALRSLVVGDIFHALFIPRRNSDHEPSLICLVTSVTNDSLSARTVTTQVNFRFNLITGLSESFDEGVYVLKNGEKLVCEIDSIAPLPIDVHNTMIGLDRKFRLGVHSRNPDARLTDAEKKALLFIAKHYPENPL